MSTSTEIVTAAEIAIVIVIVIVTETETETASFSAPKGIASAERRRLRASWTALAGRQKRRALHLNLDARRTDRAPRWVVKVEAKGRARHRREFPKSPR